MLTRRWLLASSLAVPFLERTSLAASAGPATDAACRSNIARLFPNSLAAARELGRICGDCENAAALIDRLCPEPGERDRLACASLDEVRAIFDEKIRADYRHGRFRRVDGWVLSETEIRLFAIVAAA